MSGAFRMERSAKAKVAIHLFGLSRGRLLAIAALALSSGLEGCVVVGASSRGGFFVWPGGLGLLVLLLAVVFLLRRR